MTILSEEESDALIKIGEEQSYERSTGLKINNKGKYVNDFTPSRTSLTTWCFDKCESNVYVSNIISKLSSLLGISKSNFEFGQLLKYNSCPSYESNNCSFYKQHNDFIIQDGYKLQGVRVLTFYIYLNDVASGGYTAFQRGISIRKTKESTCLGQC